MWSKVIAFFQLFGYCFSILFNFKHMFYEYLVKILGHRVLKSHLTLYSYTYSIYILITEFDIGTCQI